jgi:alpha-1,2-mannosyltransferase
MQNSATRMPSRLEWAVLPVLLVIAIGFGAMVELRSAYLSRRMGDLTCYLRPAWAALVGENIYDIKDPNGWHYNYPPLYAILLMPLADPPPGYDSAGFVPYPISVAIVYALNIACLALAVHLLAGAMQRYSTDPVMRDQPRFCRRWWALRVWPVLICLAPILHSAMRGQVNLQILAIFCAWFACALADRRRLGGFFLAVAISIKVIPIYLLVYPLWRRDGRTLTGCAIGLFAGLVAVPLVAFGPTRTVDEYTRYGLVLFGPLLNLSDDHSRHDELLGMDATDSMGFKHAIHCWMHPNPYTRPLEYSPAEEWIHRVLGVLMTLAVLWPARRVARAGPWPMVHEMGLLLLLMVFFSPVSHVHYFTFGVPLVMSLLFRRWQYGTTMHIGWPLTLTFVWFVVATGLPAWPGLEWLRDQRVPLLGALPLWIFGVVERWRCHSAERKVDATPAPRLAA